MANYRNWIKDIEDIQATRVNIPLLSDPDGAILNQVSNQLTRYWGCHSFAPFPVALLDRSFFEHVTTVAGLRAEDSDRGPQNRVQWLLPYRHRQEDQNKYQI